MHYLVINKTDQSVEVGEVTLPPFSQTSVFMKITPDNAVGKRVIFEEPKARKRKKKGDEK